MDNIVKYTMRIDRELYKKFSRIAAYDGRSVNKEIELFMKRYVQIFEEKFGEIVLTDEEK